jgi:large subunit ribosomal protein L12
MDYIYAVLLLHNAKKEINEENIKKILKSIDVEADEGKIKGLVATLKDVNIDEAIKKAATPVAAAAPTQEASEDKKEEEEEEETVSEETAVEGLGALFG